MAAGVMLLLLAVGLLPVMYLGRFNHPTGDDYYYGAGTHLVWQETGSIAETVAEAARGVALEYGRWQGTYSALFLMHLPPNIFGNLPYHLVTAVILSLLTAGIFYVTKPVLCGRLKMPVSGWMIVSSCLVLLCVETVPSQGESFFWYNGSMYYTGYFALTLFFLGMVSRYAEKQRKGYLTGMSLLAVFLAGGNYVSLLPCLIIMVLLTGWMFWKKRPGRYGILAAAFCLLAGLIVSAAAPGNRVRQDGMWQIPAWKAVAKSLVQGLRYTAAWTGLWWLLAAIIVTPVLWKYMRRSELKFRYPLVAIGLFYGIFCSMSCPTFYTMNSTGPARVVAVVYYGFLLFSFLAYGYFLGYVQRKFGGKAPAPVPGGGQPEEKESGERKSGNRERLRFGRAVIPVCVTGIVLFQIATGAAENCTTGKAVHLLSSGEAKAYDEEYRERYRLFTDDSIQELVLKPYENKPDMLYVGDFSADPQEPTNVKVAEFFGKTSVKVDYD